MAQVIQQERLNKQSNLTQPSALKPNAILHRKKNTKNKKLHKIVALKRGINGFKEIVLRQLLW